MNGSEPLKYCSWTLESGCVTSEIRAHCKPKFDDVCKAAKDSITKADLGKCRTIQNYSDGNKPLKEYFGRFITCSVARTSLDGAKSSHTERVAWYDGSKPIGAWWRVDWWELSKWRFRLSKWGAVSFIGRSVCGPDAQLGTWKTGLQIKVVTKMVIRSLGDLPASVTWLKTAKR